jgi:ATP-dependent Clp protease ATP-binding subunit ClpA
MPKKQCKRLDPNIKSEAEEELASSLKHLIVGQTRAIEVLVDAYETFRAGLAPPDHPVGNLIFLGPTGCGKTYVIEVMAELLFGTKKALKKVDCAEFQHSHDIAKLVGSPPGYLGHRDTPAYLRQESLDAHHTKELALTLLLFDEFEKSNDALWNLLLGILDKGTLTLGDNKQSTFDKCLIIMTGNLGSREMQYLARGGLGFAGSSTKSSEAFNKEVETAGLEAAKKRFTPEFLNRIDEIVVFHSLDEKQLKQVVELEIEQVQSRVLKMRDPRQFVLEFTPAAKDLLIAQGTDLKNGARPLKRIMEKLVVKRLSRFLNTKQVNMGGPHRSGQRQRRP